METLVRRVFDRCVRTLARLLLRVFYRSIEVVGVERIPATGPLLLVSNHGNALVDPALVVAFAPRMPRFLAKHVLFKHPLVRPFLSMAGSIPVYRQQDGASAKSNLETFARCHEELGRGGVIALFPEGISHHEPSLQPLKTGAARIALGAEAEHGPLGVRIVPIGLVFEEKERFRSRALVVVGEALSIEAEVEAAQPQGLAGEERRAARALTERIEAALRTVTLNTDNWEDWALSARAAQLLATASGGGPEDAPLAGEFPLRHAVIEAYHRLREKAPERATTLRAKLAAYETNLRDTELRDEQVRAATTPTRIAAFAALRVVALALWAPLVAVGWLVNWWPYRAVGLVAARVKDTPDQPATHKVMSALVLFPAWWALITAYVGWSFGWLAGAFSFLLWPLAGFSALRAHEHGRHFLLETRAYLRVRRRPSALEKLREEREALRAELRG